MGVADRRDMSWFLPTGLKDGVWFAYHTGWRKREILTLEWRGVHET